MPNFKTKKEWITAAKALHFEKGLNAAQITEQIGLFPGWVLNNSSSGGIREVNSATKLKKDKLRADKAKVPDSTRQYFPDDNSHKTYKQTVGRDRSGINARTKQATVDSGTLYHKGHIQSSDLGGSTTSRNLHLENGSNNSSHGRTSPSRGALLNTGAPVDWNNDAINYLDPDGLPYEYTPQDKQRILNAPADKVDEVTAAVDKKRWDAINRNPDARPIRTNPNPRVSNPPTKQNFNGLSLSAFDRGMTPNQKLRIDRKTVKRLAALGLAAPSVLGYAASAAETGIRTNTAVRSGNPTDWLQAGLSGASLAADGVPGVGELVSTPADAINVGIDTYRDPNFKAEPNALAARQQQLKKSLQVNPKPQPQPKSEAGYQTIGRVAQQGFNALKSSAQNNVNAALSAFGF